MKKILTSIVTYDFNGASLLGYLKNKMLVSSSLIRKAKLIENGICINGKLEFVNYKVSTGDKVEIVIQTESENSSNIPLCDLPIKIFYEDDDLLVVDKPFGVPTHPSQNN